MPRAFVPHSSEVVIDEDNNFSWPWSKFFEQLKVRIGAEKQYALGGKLFSSVTTTGNVDAGEDDLISYSLEKNTLQNEGDFLEIIAFGTYANNANNKTLKLYFDGSVIYTTAIKNPVNTSWQIIARVLRVTSTTQKVTVTFSGEALGSAVNAQYTATTANLAVANIIKCTGTGVATNDIVQQGLIISIFPAQGE